MESVSKVNLDKIDLRTIIKVAWPVALAAFFYHLPGIVDVYWIGKLTETDLAAVGVSTSVLGVMLALGQLFSAGTMAFVARFAGANDRPRAQAAVFHALVIASIIGLAVAGIGIPLSPQLLTLFAANSSVVSTGTGYMRMLFLGIPFVYVALVSVTALNATGDTLSPLLVALGANILNLVLDPLLIFGWLGFPRLGVTGAGVATLAAWILSLVISAVILLRKRLVGASGFSWSFARSFLRVGFFAMIQGITRPLTGVVMMYIVGLSGAAAQAAFGVGLRIISVSFILTTGLTIATQSLVGQCLGAENVKGAKRTVRLSIISGLIVQLVFSVLYLLAAGWLMGLFSPDKVEVIVIGSNYLRILAGFLLIMPFSMGWSGAQYGAGKTLGPALASVAANWIVKLPLAYVLSQLGGMETSGVWLAIGFSVIVETAINGVYYYKGAWKRSKL